jgi:hypothetical protein
VHATKAGPTVHASEPASGMHAAEAAVHPTAPAEAAPAVTSAASEAAATATTAAPESRRRESKRCGDHTSNHAITTSVIHPIPPLLQQSCPAGRRSADPIHSITSNE